MSLLTDANDRLQQLSGGLLTLDQLVNLHTDGGAVPSEWIYFHKDDRAQGAQVTNPIAGTWNSLWQYDGTLPGAGLPGAFANPTSSTAGGLMQADPGGGRKKLITTVGGVTNQPGTIVIYDRLAHMSGMDGTVITAQNVNGGASGDVTRYTDGVGNKLWIEIYTLIGVTGTTFTCVYKDGSLASKTSTTMAIGNTDLREAQRIIPVPFAAGGNTVVGCTSVTLLASTTTAGNFGVTIAHPLAYIPVSAINGCGSVMSFLNHPIVEVKTGACLALAFIPTSGTPQVIDAYIQTVEI